MEMRCLNSEYGQQAMMSLSARMPGYACPMFANVSLNCMKYPAYRGSAGSSRVC